MIVIDAKDAIAGRMASYVAKNALKGETVVICNAGEAVISGNSKVIVDKYRVKRGMQDKANPEHSPKFPRRPDLFLKKMIKGMLPKKVARGKLAAKRVLVYRDAPAQYKAQAKPFRATASKLHVSYSTIREVCLALGGKE